MDSLTRTQRRLADGRKQLIDIAEQLLMERGTAAVSTEEVAKRADVALQTVYNRIGGKSALVCAVAERAMEESRNYVDMAYALEGTPRERARLILDAYVRFALDRPHQFRTLVTLTGEPESLSRIAAMTAEQNSKLATIIKDCVAEGLMSPDLDPMTTANALWAMLNGILILALRDDGMRPKSISAEALVQTATRIMKLGTKARGNEATATQQGYSSSTK